MECGAGTGGSSHVRPGPLVPPAPATGDVVSFAVYPPDGAVFSSAPNTTVSTPQFAISPDGRTIVFAATMPGARSMLWRRALADVAAQVLPGTEDAVAPVWNPDGREVAFFSEGKLKKIPVAGGAAQAMAQTATDFRGSAWGPDGTILFASGTEPIHRVPSSGGPVTSATVMDTSQERSHRYPSFLPDGRHFL